MRNHLARVAPRPKLIGLDGLVHFAGDVLKVESGDAEAFAVADAVAQVVGLPGIVRGQTRLAQIRVVDAQADIGHGKVGVEFDGALHVGNGFGIALGAAGGHAHAVGLQSVQGGRRRFHGHVEFLHGHERLAEARAQRGGGSIQCLEHSFFAGGFGVFVGQVLAVAASNGIERDYILAAQGGDGTRNHGLAARAQAKFRGDCSRNALGGGATHQLECFASLAVGKNIQKRRLLQIDGERLLECAVEDWVTGGVGEIRQHNRVFLGQRRGGMRGARTKIESASREDRQNDGTGHDVSAEPSRPGNSGIWDFHATAAAGGSAGIGPGSSRRLVRFRIPLEPLQIGSHVGRMLIAQIAVLLQSLVDDPFQFRPARRDSAAPRK